MVPKFLPKNCCSTITYIAICCELWTNERMEKCFLVFCFSRTGLANL